MYMYHIIDSQTSTSITLGKELGSGDNSTVYEIDDTRCAKLYKSHAQTADRIQKLKSMMKKDVSVGTICYPAT